MKKIILLLFAACGVHLSAMEEPRVDESQKEMLFLKFFQNGRLSTLLEKKTLSVCEMRKFYLKLCTDVSDAQQYGSNIWEQSVFSDKKADWVYKGALYFLLNQDCEDFEVEDLGMKVPAIKKESVSLLYYFSQNAQGAFNRPAPQALSTLFARIKESRAAYRKAIVDSDAETIKKVEKEMLLNLFDDNTSLYSLFANLKKLDSCWPYAGQTSPDLPPTGFDLPPTSSELPPTGREQTIVESLQQAQQLRVSPKGK